MCGRSSLTKTEKEIEARFNATFYSDELERYNPLPNFNVAPTHMHPVITSDEPDRIHLFRWGLVPFWAKDIKIGAKMINARVESLLEKSAFKSLMKSKRCIIPMDGFYEWKKDGKKKIPFRVTTKDQEIFAVAGLWDCWKEPSTDRLIYTYTVITCLPNHKVNTIHDRMPAILLPENEKEWIDKSILASDAIDLIMPYPEELTDMYPVSENVNSVKINDHTLIDPLLDNTKPFQTSLF